GQNGVDGDERLLEEVRTSRGPWRLLEEGRERQFPALVSCRACAASRQPRHADRGCRQSGVALDEGGPALFRWRCRGRGEGASRSRRGAQGARLGELGVL